MLGKSDQQEVPDNDDVDDLNHSSLSNTNELRSADCYDHRLLSRKTRLV